MKTPLKIALSVTSLLVIAGVAAGIYLYTKPQKDLQKAHASHFITAEELQMEFRADEKAASEKYLNKVIEVSGTIAEIEIREGRTISIILATKDAMSSVICNFSEPQDPEKLIKDKRVTIRGELSGFLMDVLLNNCVIVGNSSKD